MILGEEVAENIYIVVFVGVNCVKLLCKGLHGASIHIRI